MKRGKIPATIDNRTMKILMEYGYKSKSGAWIKLSIKEKMFVDEYLRNGMNGKQAILSAGYDCKEEDTASVLAFGKLKKDNVRRYLNDMIEINGFNEENAKVIVSEIANNETEKSSDRLKATDMIMKVKGTYAPEKHFNVNANFTLKSLFNEEDSNHNTS